MRVVFLALITLCSQAVVADTRTIALTGTIANIQSWEIKGYYTAMMVNTVGMPPPGAVWTAPQLMVDLKTGHVEGEIECDVLRNSDGRWVDFHLVIMNVTFQVFREMVIRVPYAQRIDLGTFDWKPSHYRWKAGALVIDTGVPRDTIVGDPFGDHVCISPINPEPGDSMRFAFVWNNNGAPHQASMGGYYMKDCCTVLCDLTFAVRTDTDVFCDSWLEHVTLHLLPDREGRYRLRQVPAQGGHLRDVDFLLGKDLRFAVGERREP